MNAFFYPSKRGINFAKIRGFKFTDYKERRIRPGNSLITHRIQVIAWQRGTSDRSSVISNFESPNFRKVNSPF